MTALAALAAHGCASPGQSPPPRSASEARVQGSGRPACDPRQQIARFQTISKTPLTRIDRIAGAITTPLKYLSTMINGPGAWRDTGCDAWGIGTPVWATQHSTDGLYTIDIALAVAEVNGASVPAGRFVRLEVLPSSPAHKIVRKRRPQPSDIIRFHGPLVWDKDKRPDHPLGHMEIHPIQVEFVATSPR